MNPSMKDYWIKFDEELVRIAREKLRTYGMSDKEVKQAHEAGFMTGNELREYEAMTDANRPEYGVPRMGPVYDSLKVLRPWQGDQRSFYRTNVHVKPATPHPKIPTAEALELSKVASANIHAYCEGWMLVAFDCAEVFTDPRSCIVTFHWRYVGPRPAGSAWTYAKCPGLLFYQDAKHAYDVRSMPMSHQHDSENSGSTWEYMGPMPGLEHLLVR